MDGFVNALRKFFFVVADGRSYLTILYLLLSFPLGVAYFVFLVTGISVGVALSFLVVGLLLLLVVFAGWWGMAVLERQLAIWLLKEQIAPMSRVSLQGLGLWDQFKTVVSNPVTWKSLLYLFVKFPLCIVNFIVAITGLATSAALLAAPFVYRWMPYQISFDFGRAVIVDSLGEALILFVIGVFVTLISMHVMNALGWVNGKFARVMLGSGAPAVSTPAPSAPVPAAQSQLPV